MEKKDFKNILMRDVDESIVNIINRVMSERNIKTATDSVAYIIHRYEKQKQDLEDKNRRISELETAARKAQHQAEEYKTVLRGFKALQDFVTKI